MATLIRLIPSILIMVIAYLVIDPLVDLAWILWVMFTIIAGLAFCFMLLLTENKFKKGGNE